MRHLPELFANNRAWAAQRIVQDPKAVSEVAATMAAVAKGVMDSVRPGGHGTDQHDQQAPGSGTNVEHIDVR